MENVKVGMLENFMRNQQRSLQSLFQRKKSSSSYGEDDSSNSPKPIPLLSPLANSVVSRCSKILQVPTEDLQHCFDTELPESVKELLTYARNLLEFCSYKALQQLTKSLNYLSDKEFRRLTYDMMLAWEAPCVESDPLQNETASTSKQELEEDDGWSLFYSSSTNTAIQVDDNKTVGCEAFTRIAPICASIADIITVHNLFDSLTNSSGQRLHFLVYDKYIRSLDKIIKSSKNVLAASIGNLQLAEGEIVLDVDGTVPTQPVLQHIGISAWPGRLTMTNCALYFESLGVGVYEKAVRYDLETDMKQVIKPEMTGPLGARLFDKAVIAEPAYFEFPEINSNSRRNYWLDICLEILRVQKFIRKYKLKEIQKSDILARAILGILRYRRLANLTTDAGRHDVLGTPGRKQQLVVSPAFLVSLGQHGFISQKETDFPEEAIVVGDFRVGETNPLEMAVKKSVLDTGRAEAARATVEKVKVEGIDTNVAVMKELLFPVIESASRVKLLASWKDSYKSTAFFLFTCYIIMRGWVRYVLPSMFMFTAILMLWRSHFNKGSPLQAFRITPPPNRNAVEQLLTLQESITQVETSIQAANVVLLKIRALLFAVVPQATERFALLLVFMAATLAFVPSRYIILLVFVEIFTREMPYRKESSERWLRRAREWWVRIPAAPVQLIKPVESKKKK
ncbi:Plant protein of unknown function (DUF639) [Quillaja saponaria]|uniref:Uncharacterized protein n=1 Tax=Quillaja saponaria TaxID=32244 RepID=A0AAD7LCA3_QUISA|nr:Plant protein of unknown function (DUF639) [Quillaja saponaria]